MKPRPFNTEEILKSCQEGVDAVLVISAEDFVVLRSWANRKKLSVKRIADGAIVSTNRIDSARREIITKLTGTDADKAFTVYNKSGSYVRNIISQFNIKNNPGTPWKVKKLPNDEYMIYSEPEIPKPNLI